MENVAVCTRCKVWARCDQYMLRRSPLQEDGNARALDTRSVHNIFHGFFPRNLDME